MESLYTDTPDDPAYQWIEIGIAPASDRLASSVEAWAASLWGTRRLSFPGGNVFLMDGVTFQAVPEGESSSWRILRRCKKPLIQTKWLKFSPNELKDAL